MLNKEEVRHLVEKLFVYDMPFNQELGLESCHLDATSARIRFHNQTKLVGNAIQQILHGGVIAAVLDVTAGLVCVGNALLREESISEEDLYQRLAKMGTVDLRVDYLRPGRGQYFTADATLLRGGNKISVARVELYNDDKLYIASATATYLVG